MYILLSRGDSKMKKYHCVGIISPSTGLRPCEDIDISAGIAYLERLGLKVKTAPSVCRGMRRYDGNVQEKAADIMAMYLDDEVDLLLAAHGGAGALHVLEYLDYAVIKKHPKPIVGFSDTTSLQLAVYAKTGAPFVTGFLPEYDFRGGMDIHSLVDTGVKDFLAGRKFAAQSGQTLRGGAAEGVLLGECLSTISDLSGSPYYPDLADKILLLEDECESAYKISLMLTQLRYHPQFEKVRGIVFGRFSDCADHPTQGSLSEVIADFVSRVRVPVLGDFDFGHFRERFVLPCGVCYRLDADNRRLEQIAEM